MKRLSDKDINELYTYCVLNENGKNIVEKIRSRKIFKWKKEYIARFKTSYISRLKKTNLANALYCDPDTTYKKSLDNHFFERLVIFLNEQENYFSNEKDIDKKTRLEGKYVYEFEANKGIKVSNINKKKDSFYLKSDQLGFSAPTNEKVYPYDLFLMKSRECDKALEQVADWIVASRTVGGSFLWPEVFYKKYNSSRGGKINSKNKFYIQDRVDLTLWEIYYWYHPVEKRQTKMMGVKDEKEAKALKKWLSHFKTFETYIKFFCFEDFVNEKSCPINILSGGAEEPQWNNNTSDRKPEITEQLDKKTIYKMLDRVNTMILKRSMRIEEIIKQRI